MVKHPKQADTLFLAADDGVYLSTDTGQTWGAINEGLMTTAVVYDLAFDPNNPDDLYALTPFGIFRLEKL